MHLKTYPLEGIRADFAPIMVETRDPTSAHLVPPGTWRLKGGIHDHPDV